jgi:addiction module HigA family antidote
MAKTLPQPGEVPLAAGVHPVPPAVFLAENYLKPRGLDVAKAAKKMHLPVAVLADVLALRTPVNGSIAACFAEFTRTKPRVWLNMQAAADRAAAKAGS